MPSIRYESFYIKLVISKTCSGYLLLRTKIIYKNEWAVSQQLPTTTTMSATDRPPSKGNNNYKSNGDNGELQRVNPTIDGGHSAMLPTVPENTVQLCKQNFALRTSVIFQGSTYSQVSGFSSLPDAATSSFTSGW